MKTKYVVKGLGKTNEETNKLKTYSPKRIVSIVMPILWPFLVILLPTTLESFTKLWFRQSFGHEQHVKILTVSKKQQIKQTFPFPLFYNFVKQKAANLCHLNGYFKTISGHFSTNHIRVTNVVADHGSEFSGY